MTKHYCQKCQRLVCKQTKGWNWKLGTCKLSPGTEMIKREHEAPRVKCSCGQVIILLQGSTS